MWVEEEIAEANEEQIAKAAELIRKGEVVAFPTETVYGLGANTFDERAVRKIFSLKGRPLDNPLIVHISKKEDLPLIAVDIPEQAYKLIDSFWPGPLTIVLKKNLTVPDIVTAGLDSVAVRMPSHKVALKLIDLAGVPIAAPSANPAGKPSATKAEHIRHYFGDKVFVLEGKIKIGIESTVVDLTSPLEPLLLRPGMIEPKAIEKVIGKRLVHCTGSERPKSPGLKYQHYSPNAELIVASKEKLFSAIEKMREERLSQDIVVVVFGDQERALRVKEKFGLDTISAGRTLEEVARNLFDILITFGEKYDVIIFESVEEEGVGLGIMNRLKKAAKQIID